MAMRSEMIGKPLEGFAEYVRAAAAEGAVLLKNEGGVLPLKKGERIAVFGRTQTDFYRSGTGSGGSVNVEYTTNLLDGLRDGGVVQVDEELAAVYAAWLEEHPLTTAAESGQENPGISRRWLSARSWSGRRPKEQIRR